MTRSKHSRCALAYLNAIVLSDTPAGKNSPLERGGWEATDIGSGQCIQRSRSIQICLS